MKIMLIMGASALLLSASIADAATKKAASKPPTEASIECSKQATDQGLKGKPRQAFRAKCMKNYKKA